MAERTSRHGGRSVVGSGRRCERENKHKRKGAASGADAAVWRRGAVRDEPSEVGQFASGEDHVAPRLGTCAAMCSDAEVRSRVETKDVSRFERTPDAQEDKSKAAWAAKKYRRPAAGRVDVDVAELRPPAVLTATLAHLFGNVLPWSGCGFDWTPTKASDVALNAPSLPASLADQHEFLSLYHFLNDRLRSVRQDFVIQRVSGLSRVSALVQIARFYILASFRAKQLLDLSNKTLDWSETLNNQQLASALTEIHAQSQSVDAPVHEDVGLYHQLRDEAIAYDVLVHMRDPHAVSLLLLKVPAQQRRRGVVQRVIALFVAFHTGDFYTLNKINRQLPMLQHCLVLRHLPVVWTATLQTMNKAFGKIDRFALTEIAEWMDLGTQNDARVLCAAMNICIENVDAWETPTEDPIAQPLRELTGFFRFKVNSIREELEEEVENQLVYRKGVSVMKTISRQFTAATLVIHGDLTTDSALHRKHDEE